jgi:hypothetical protein
VIALVAVAEQAEFLGVRVDEGQQVQRRLLVALQSHLGGIGHLEQGAQPAADAVAIEPVREGQAIQFVDRGRAAAADVIADHGLVARDQRGHRRERLQHFMLAAQAAVEIPAVFQARCFRADEVIERQFQFRRELVHARMPAVDELSAEFAYLAVGEVVAQAQHAAAAAVLRLDDAHRHAGLAQTPSGGESGDAGADDDDLANLGRARRHAGAGSDGQRRGGDRALLQEAPPRRALRIGALQRFIERFAARGGGAGNGEAAREQARQRRTRHAYLPPRERPSMYTGFAGVSQPRSRVSASPA